MARVKIPGDDPDRIAPARPQDDDPPSKDDPPHRDDDWHDLLEFEMKGQKHPACLPPKSPGTKS